MAVMRTGTGDVSLATQEQMGNLEEREVMRRESFSSYLQSLTPRLIGIATQLREERNPLERTTCDELLRDLKRKEEAHQTQIESMKTTERQMVSAHQETMLRLRGDLQTQKVVLHQAQEGVRDFVERVSHRTEELRRALIRVTEEQRSEQQRAEREYRVLVAEGEAQIQSLQERIEQLRRHIERLSRISAEQQHELNQLREERRRREEALQEARSQQDVTIIRGIERRMRQNQFSARSRPYL